MAELQPRQLTWAVLLGRWVEFARSAVALPDDAAGRAMRAAVPDIIGLQAVAMALRDMGELDEAERAVGLDRAAVLIQKHEAALRALFATDPLHAGVEELIADAKAALREAGGGQPM